MTFIRVVGSGGLAGLLILLAYARADEVKVPLKDVPKAVLDSIKAKFPRAELTEATKETEDGKTTYEIALKDGGRAVDVAATADGKITEIETAIDAKALPAKVTAALADKYPKATLKKAEEIVEIKNGTETKTFEVVVMTTAEKSVEVKLSPEGKILKEEQADD
jgi:hypothetical protein